MPSLPAIGDASGTSECLSGFFMGRHQGVYFQPLGLTSDSVPFLVESQNPNSQHSIDQTSRHATFSIYPRFDYTFLGETKLLV